MNSNAKKVNALGGMPAWFWLGLLLAAATVAAYWPVFSAGFIWDDDFYVTHNLALRDSDGLRQIWFNINATLQYYPLVHSVFWLEYHCWGLQPLGYHVVNVVFHIAGAMLLWRVLAGLELPGAWLAAAIFALHPVEAESVVWVTELKNVLSSVFYFSAALCYLRFAGLDGNGGGGGADGTLCAGTRPTGLDGRGEGGRWRWHFYIAALLLFLGALLSKTVTCSLPAALALVIWWKRADWRWRDYFPLAPFFIIGLLLGLASAWFEKHEVGANGAEWSLTPADRCLIAGRALWFYAAKLCWPAQLAFIYPRWEINAGLWWQWLFPCACVALVAGLWCLRLRVGKGPLVAVLFFGGTVLPALGFANVYPMRFSFVADHFQYLAGIGLIVLGVGLALKLAAATRASRRWQAGLATLLLLVLGVLTWRHCHIYKNLETLWADTLNKNPLCWMAHSNLGSVLAQQGRLAEAEAHYRQALDLNSGEESIHYNFGNLLAKTGRLEEAAAQYHEAIELAPAKPEAHNNLGFILNKQHRTDEAIAEYERAIHCQPDYADAYYNLGNALAAEHNLEAAVAAYQRAVRLNPDSELFRKRLQAVTGQ